MSSGLASCCPTAEGLAELITFLREIAPLDQIACIVETTEGLLISTLLEAGCTIYPVNPKTIDRRRNAAGAKTDAIDAYLLAKTGRSDLADLRKLIPDSAMVQELKVLTRDQDSLVQSQTSGQSAYRLSKASYPVALQLFSKLQQRTTLVFLRTYPTLMPR